MGEGDGIEMSAGVSFARSGGGGGRGGGASGTSQAHPGRCHLPGGDWKAGWEREKERERVLREEEEWGKVGRQCLKGGGCREGGVKWG